MEDKGNNPVGSGGSRSFGKVPLSAYLRCLDADELGEALAKIRDCDAWWAVKYCLSFMALTCVRSNEASGATWDEVDLDKAEWTIPAIRMKNGVRHRVLLSTQAVEILAYALEQGGGQGLIFPSRRGGKVIHPGTLSKLFFELEIPAVPHGLRATFMNWAGGRAHIPELEAQLVLAHQPSSAVVSSFLTSNFSERRVPVMQEWGDFLTETMEPVVPDTLDRR